MTGVSNISGVVVLLVNHIKGSDILEYIRLKDSYDVNDVEMVLYYGNMEEYDYSFLSYMLKVMREDSRYELKSDGKIGLEDRIDKERVISVIGNSSYAKKKEDCIYAYIKPLAREVARLTIEGRIGEDTEVEREEFGKVREVIDTLKLSNDKREQMRVRLVRTFTEVYKGENDVTDEMTHKLWGIVIATYRLR